MLGPARIWRRIRALVEPRKLSSEVDEEMQFHLDMETERLVAGGMDETRARTEARRSFGALPQYRDEARDARGVRPIEDFVMDVRFGIRSLARRPAFSVVAILTLAIGIGATTALGSAVYRVLLAPYPFPDASRIITLWETNVAVPNSTDQVSSGNFIDWKNRARSFDLLAAAEPFSFDWVGPEGPERFQSVFVTQDFFALQGLRPLHGRVFLPEEFQPGRDNVVVLTETVFRARFGSDTAIVGRTLVLDSVPRLVVGVMSHDAIEPFDAEMWAPKIYRPQELTARTGGYWQVVGRLAPGVTLEQAQAEMTGIARALGEEYPATNKQTGAAVVTLRDAIAGNVRQSLLVLFGAVGFVMLIACVNVANLQLGEAVRRRRELAIRTAIGAGRGRLVRQLFAESLVVALIGAGAGLFVAFAGIAAIRVFSPDELWQLRRLYLDGSTLVFALVLAFIAALAIAIMPVVASGRIALGESLAAGGRSHGGIHRRRANRVLVISEVALALVLLVGAGLLLRSLSELGRTRRGFETDSVAVITLQAWGYYPTFPARAEFVRQVVERVGSLPGVDEIGMTSALPLSWPIGFERAPVNVEGRADASGTEQQPVRVSAVTHGFFAALRIPIQAGRPIDANDRVGTAPVALVNEAFARRYFPDGKVLGRRISFGFMGPPVAREIVGVVGDVRHDGLHADPAPGVFVPHAQAPTGAIHLVMRVNGDVNGIQRMAREELRVMNGAMPIEGMTTMNALLAQSLLPRRFQMTLLACFSLTALLLASIGIYGVMSRATSERTHEIGIRLAVGAQPRDVRWMVLRTGGALALIGIAVGLGAATVLTRYMTVMLYGVEALDPITYAAAVALLLGAGMVATFIPAWRASGVDPVVALRSE